MKRAGPRLETSGIVPDTGGSSMSSSLRARPQTRWWALVVISLTQLIVVLDGTIVSIALPQAQASLGLTDGQRQWVVTAYALAFGALLLLGGRIADYVGRKRVFMIGMVAVSYTHLTLPTILLV